MRVVRLDPKPIDRVRYLNAGRRGKTVSSVLDIVRGEATGLPEGLDALVVTSDLQGVAPSWHQGGANVLLGEHRDASRRVGRLLRALFSGTLRPSAA